MLVEEEDTKNGAQRKAYEREREREREKGGRQGRREEFHGKGIDRYVAERISCSQTILGENKDMF